MKKITAAVICIAALIFSAVSCAKADKENTSSGASSKASSMASSDPMPQSSDVDSTLPVNVQSIISTPTSSSALAVKDYSALNNTKSGFGPGAFAEGVRPPGTAKMNDLFAKYDSIYIMPESKNIYLTFDCGYENGYTPKILDAMLAENVKGVFFITMPYAKGHPELVQRMIDEGHIVGNHSVNHPSFPTVSVEKQINEVKVLHDYVLEKFSYTMKYFRFPMGEYSEKSLAILKDLGYKSVFWSFAYVDFDVKKQPSVEKAVSTVLTRSHPGAVYLLHAISSANANGMSEMIKGLREKGYTLKLLDF